MVSFVLNRKGRLLSTLVLKLTENGPSDKGMGV